MALLYPSATDPAMCREFTFGCTHQGETKSNRLICLPPPLTLHPRPRFAIHVSSTVADGIGPRRRLPTARGRLPHRRHSQGYDARVLAVDPSRGGSRGRGPPQVG